MPWSLERQPDPERLVLTYTGVVSRGELAKSADEAVRLVRETGVAAMLADCREMASGGHSLADLYFTAERVAASGLAYRLREAVLMPRQTGAMQNVNFWETTSGNHGFTVRLFDDLEAALDWLGGNAGPGESAQP